MVVFDDNDASRNGGHLGFKKIKKIVYCVPCYCKFVYQKSCKTGRRFLKYGHLCVRSKMAAVPPF